MAERRWLEAVMAGERRGVLAGAWRTAMWLPLLGYASGNALRQAAFGFGLRRAQRLPVPVICVGNLSAGGTGKTPAVIWLARELIAGGVPRVGLVSRGYRADAAGHNDEAKLLARALPDMPHVANRSRAAAGRELLAAHPDVACIVLDDGFSHRQLARDLDLVLIDATRPFGFGELLPRGLLREPPAALRRAHAVVLTRADQIPAAELAALRARVARHLAPGAPIAEAEHAAVGLRTLAGDDLSLAQLADSPVLAGSGIGNPAAFRRSLHAAGATVLHDHSLPDHHAWTAADVAAVNGAAASGSATVVVTDKDAVKLAALPDPPTNWLVLQIAFRLRDTGDAAALRQRIRDAAATGRPLGRPGRSG